MNDVSPLPPIVQKNPKYRCCYLVVVTLFGGNVHSSDGEADPHSEVPIQTSTCPIMSRTQLSFLQHQITNGNQTDENN